MNYKTLITGSLVVIAASTAAIIYAIAHNTEIPMGSSVTWRDGTGTSITGRVQLAMTKDGNPLMGYRLRVKDAKHPAGEYIVGIPEKHILGVEKH
jgi:hypothetical protein